MSATVRREQDGIFFGGDTGGSAPAGMASGGGGSGYDVRWNDEEYRLEKSDGGAWQTVLQFVEFDA